jgi:hypothetical protein
MTLSINNSQHNDTQHMDTQYKCTQRAPQHNDTLHDNTQHDTQHNNTQHNDLSRAPLLGRLLASSTNMRQGWKGLPRTNTLAYYENP